MVWDSPHWKGGDQNEENKVHDAVYNLMTNTVQLQIRHIALPPIGAGMFKVPIDISLKNFIDAIKMHFNYSGPTSIETVFFTINQTYEIREIIKALQEYFGKAQVTLIKNELDNSLVAMETYMFYLKL